MWGKLRDTLIGFVLSFLRNSAGPAAFITWLVAVWGLMIAQLPAMLATIWETLPEDVQTDLGPYRDALEVANAWMPVMEGLQIVLALWSFQITFIVFKLGVRIFVPIFGK